MLLDMKKALWWILGILLSPILLFLILTMLLYFPPVQNWAVDKVAAIASDKTGMQITVNHVDLSFPWTWELTASILSKNQILLLMWNVWWLMYSYCHYWKVRSLSIP